MKPLRLADLPPGYRLKSNDAGWWGLGWDLLDARGERHSGFTSCSYTRQEALEKAVWMGARAEAERIKNDGDGCEDSP